MKYVYQPKGVCSREIQLEIGEDGVIRSVHFVGGCNGNTKGIAALVEGSKAEDVLRRIRGIQCGNKASSCPDQLSYAIEEALAAQKQTVSVG